MLERLAVGDVPAKHHIALRGPGGELRYEHCITRNGFDGPYTIAYHLRRPHTARQVEPEHTFPIAEPALLDAPVALRRRHYVSERVDPGESVGFGRRPFVFNKDVVCSITRATQADAVYFSNGDGDDLHYVFRGAGTLRTMFGDVRYAERDYVFVPRGTIHRFVPDQGTPHHFFSVECRGGMGLLEQWRNGAGQLRMDAPYCHRDFRRPEFRGPLDEGIRHLVVKKHDRFEGYVYDESPLDVVGWDGAVYPWVFPILCFQPRVGLTHLPPTWHGTFGARGALICSFVPRPVDFHPEAIPCPYPHSSVDVDEVLFYCDGNFTSRKGVGPGSISLHPSGLPHGPHPGAYEKSIGTKETTELAVMLDCYEPLVPTRFAVATEDLAYHESFR
ncbi:MAG TPA: homogentisate 1,2-dioxygenase [Polyangiaceae bacterium]|nr:homogentisate 1,2-dioxygenase [Polyangiaceae bacterium]